MYESCRCPNGMFNEHDGARCGAKGMQVWGTWYPTASLTVIASFLLLFSWCSVRCVAVYRYPTRKSQRAVAITCFWAVFVRIVHLIVQETAMYRNSQIEYQVAGKLESAFLSITVASCVCVCQYWQRLINVMDGNPQLRWNRKPCFGVGLVWVLELIHFIDGPWGIEPIYGPFYFIFLCAVDVAIAIRSVRVAWSLYRLVRRWVTSQALVAFGKVLVSALALAALNIAFFAFSILREIWARWYAWPWLIATVLERFLEIAYVSLMLHATAVVRPAEESPTENNTTTSLQDSQGEDDLFGEPPQIVVADCDAASVVDAESADAYQASMPMVSLRRAGSSELIEVFPLTANRSLGSNVSVKGLSLSRDTAAQAS